MNWKCLTRGHDWDLGRCKVSRCRHCDKRWSPEAESLTGYYILIAVIVVLWLLALVIVGCVWRGGGGG